MKQLISFIIKEFIHIFRDVRTMIILFGIPVAQLLIFGTVIKNEINEIGIAIYDQSNDATTIRLADKITSSGFFTLKKTIHHPDEINKLFREGNVRSIIVFEKSFGEKLIKEGKAAIQVITDASDPVTARLTLNYARGIINDFLKKEFPGRTAPRMVNTETRMVFNEGMKSAYLFVPGVMALILMLISALMTSVSITREKEMGTMEVLLASPLRPYQIIIGKVFPYIFLSIANAVIILMVGSFIFNVPVRGSTLLLMTETILYIVMALSLGILISTVAKDQMMAMFISLVGLMLPTILLSGFIFPIDNMPYLLRLISNIMPARWFVEIIRSIMLKGTGLAIIWKPTLIITGMTLLFISISVKKFKTRLQ